MTATVSVYAITPCLPHRLVARTNLNVGELVGRRAALVDEIEIEVATETQWYEYIVEVKGQLEPGEYTVEIVGEGTKIQSSETFKDAPYEDTTWSITLRGPALPRFVARLVTVRSFWKFGTVLMVDGAAPIPEAGTMVYASIDAGEDKVQVTAKHGAPGPVLYIERRWLTAVPKISG